MLNIILDTCAKFSMIIMSTKLIFRRILFGKFLRSTNFKEKLNPVNQIRNYSSFPRKLPRHMRFIQFLRKNDTRPRLAVVSEDGDRLSEISTGSCVSSDLKCFIKQGISLEELQRKIDKQSWEPVDDKIELISPIQNPEKIICIGLNYSGHCKEQNKEPPGEPMFFSKFASTLVGPLGDVIAHSSTKKLDWEIELAVIIGKEAKQVPKARAMDYVFGYSIAQDISARDWQKERNGGQFLIGKSMDTFCPLGPSVVHKGLINDPHNLQLTCKINGELKQTGNTSEMIFRIDDIISRLSETITLKPGDVILTGTPAGVGMHRKPPEYLKPGDVIESEIQCIGKLINTVVAP